LPNSAEDSLKHPIISLITDSTASTATREQKLRIYQDAIDVAGGENPFLLGLANVKYIISDASD